MSVISFLNESQLRKFIDPEAYEIIDYLLRKVAFSQPETNSEAIYDIQIPKEYLERWITQACSLIPIGAGNYPIDAYKDHEYGVDVKFVSASVDKNGNLTNGDSNESSLGQNFKDAGMYLDQAFEKKEYGLILDGWKKILNEKLNNRLSEMSLSKLYYFLFIRGGSKIHLAIAEVNTKVFNELSVSRSSGSSVFVNNFIEEEYGNVKIYKAKKRMELRLKAKRLQDDGLLISWDYKDFYPQFVSIKDLVNRGELESHIEAEFKRFFKV